MGKEVCIMEAMNTSKTEMPGKHGRGQRRSGGRRSSGRRRSRMEQLQEVLQRQSYDFIMFRKGGFYEI